MDHDEFRSWVGWRRYMLLCLIAYLFVIKLRHEYSYQVHGPGFVPHVDDPVSLDDCRQAAGDMQEQQVYSVSRYPVCPAAAATSADNWPCS